MTMPEKLVLQDAISYGIKMEKALIKSRMMCYALSIICIVLGVIAYVK